MSNKAKMERLQQLIDVSPKQMIRMLEDHGKLLKDQELEVTVSTAENWRKRGIAEFI